LSGSGVKARFAELRLPRFSPSLPVWALIGLAYYAICFVLLSRLFAAPERTALHWTAVGLVGLVLVLNGCWNYLFFRRQSLRAACWFFVPYDAVMLVLAVIVSVVDPLGAVLLGSYGAYLIYVTWWTFRLWQLNGE
jgi:tryptophan-rich sensory protein